MASFCSRTVLHQNAAGPIAKTILEGSNNGDQNATCKELKQLVVPDKQYGVACYNQRELLKIMLKQCCRRFPKGKGVFLAFVLCVLESFVFYEGYAGLFATALQNEFENILIFQTFSYSIARIVYPCAGLLSDTYFGRKRVIHFSMWCILVSLVAMSITFSVQWNQTTSSIVFKSLLVVFYVCFCVATGLFETIILLIGIDQLQGVSTEEISGYFYWFYWTRQLGCLLNILASYGASYIHTKWPIVQSLIGSSVIALGIMLYFTLNKMLLKEGPRSNPLKLISRVTWFAMTVKRRPPQQKRAFRYGEVMRSRMELAKKEFDGPFESEEVEDVKTFHGLMMLFTATGFLFAVYYGILALLNSQAQELITSLHSSPDVSLTYIARNFIATFDIITLLIMIPVLNNIAPCFRWFHSTTLKFKIGVGYLIECIACVCLVFVERLISTDALSLMWILLPAVFWSFSEMVFAISALELAYAQSPEQMRGLLLGLYYALVGLFNIVGGFIVFFVQKYYFGLYTWEFITSIVLSLTGLCGFALYVVAAWTYKNRQRPSDDEEDLRIQHYATAYYFPSSSPT